MKSASVEGSFEMRLLVWRGSAALVAFDILRFGTKGGFARMHRSVSQWTVSRQSPSEDSVNRVCDAVNRACVWYPKRVRCLQRSFAITWLLRRCGVHAQMVIGAQKFPFKAHAWVEVDGSAVNERQDVQKIYRIWERC